MNPARLRVTEPTLAELVQRAVIAQETMRALSVSASDDTFNYWERQTEHATEALLDRLAAFGITKAMASKMGGVL